VNLRTPGMTWSPPLRLSRLSFNGRHQCFSSFTARGRTREAHAVACREKDDQIALLAQEVRARCRYLPVVCNVSAQKQTKLLAAEQQLEHLRNQLKERDTACANLRKGSCAFGAVSQNVSHVSCSP
jgi:hypothetical protein